MTNTPTIEIDGHQWIQRGGEPWGEYETLRSYGGFKSVASVASFVSRHNLNRIKHGKKSLCSKNQFDSVTGAVSRRSD